MTTLSDAQAKVEALEDYIAELAGALNEQDQGAGEGEFNDEGFDSWRQSWEAFRYSIRNATQAQFESAYTEDGFDMSLQTWRDSANLWWATARKTGRIRKPGDAGTDIKDAGPEEPDEDTPGKVPPKAKPPTGGGGGKKPPATDETKDSKKDGPVRKKPWIALAIVLAPLGVYALSRKGR